MQMYSICRYLFIYLSATPYDSLDNIALEHSGYLVLLCRK